MRVPNTQHLAALCFSFKYHPHAKPESKSSAKELYYYEDSACVEKVRFISREISASSLCPQAGCFERLKL